MSNSWGPAGETQLGCDLRQLSSRRLRRQVAHIFPWPTIARLWQLWAFAHVGTHFPQPHSGPFQVLEPVGERLHFGVKRANRCCVAPLAHFDGRSPFVKLPVEAFSLLLV